MSDNGKYEEIDKLLRQIITKPEEKVWLKDLFEARLSELGISASAAGELIGIEWRALMGVIEGTQKRVDYITLSKLARFLNLENQKLIEYYIETLEANFKDELSVTNRTKFLLENFDLPALKKIEFINNITDFEHIEERVKLFFGFNSIFEYTKPRIQPAFSAGALNYRSTLSRSFWIKNGY